MKSSKDSIRIRSSCPTLGYNKYLQSHGLDGENPWESWANSAIDEQGKIVSGWQMRNARFAARVPEEHSETRSPQIGQLVPRWFTSRRCWCLHLSYIKPHWPYLAPAPYHQLYGAEEVLPRCAATTKKKTPIRFFRPSWLKTTVKTFLVTRFGKPLFQPTWGLLSSWIIILDVCSKT